MHDALVVLHSPTQVVHLFPFTKVVCKLGFFFCSWRLPPPPLGVHPVGLTYSSRAVTLRLKHINTVCSQCRYFILNSVGSKIVYSRGSNQTQIGVCMCLSACEEEVFEECQECLLFTLGRNDGGQTIVFHGSWHHRPQSCAVPQGPCGTKKIKTTGCVRIFVRECTF